jgi:hypothetical protein
VLVSSFHRAEREHAGAGDRRADDRPRLVTAGARDDLAGADRRHQHAGHHGHELQAGLRRRCAAHDLLEQRQVGQRAEQREADHEADHAGDREHAVAEQLRRQHRLGRPLLDPHERDQRDDGDHAEPDDERRVPVVLRPAERREQRYRQDAEREHAQRQVHVEDPPPREVRREEPADQRPGHARHAEHGAEETHPLAALAR